MFRDSPLVFISRYAVAPLTRFEQRQILFRPKRFAAGIGLFMSATALVLSLIQLPLAAAVVTGILALFCFLEAFLRFCAGCKIFALLIRLGVFEEDLCMDCTL